MLHFFDSTTTAFLLLPGVSSYFLSFSLFNSSARQVLRTLQSSISAIPPFIIMSTTSSISYEELKAAHDNLQSRLYTQYKELSSIKATLDRAVEIIACLKAECGAETIYAALQETMQNLEISSEDIGAIMAKLGEQGSTDPAPPFPPNAAIKQTKTKTTASITTTAPLQRPESDSVAQLLELGFHNVDQVVQAVELAGENKELAIFYLVEGFPPPQMRREIRDLVDPYRFGSSGRAMVYDAAVNPTGTERKASSSSFAVAAPISPAPNAVSPTSSPAPTSALPPCSPHAATLSASRKSSIAPEERAALFASVQKLAPSSKISGFWAKVRSNLTSAGFVKSESAWKVEWSRYGAYEHSFDERKGVFVNSEKERLKLLRCLSAEQKARVKRELEELEEYLVETGPAKRQKIVEALVEAEEEGVDFVLTAGDALISSFWDIPVQEYVEEVKALEVDTPIDFDFAGLDGAGFGLEDGNMPQIAGGWILTGVGNGLGFGIDFELDFGGDFGAGYDTSYDGGFASEAFNHGFHFADDGEFMI